MDPRAKETSPRVFSFGSGEYEERFASCRAKFGIGVRNGRGE